MASFRVHVVMMMLVGHYYPDNGDVECKSSSYVIRLGTLTHIIFHSPYYYSSTVAINCINIGHLGNTAILYVTCIHVYA